jgi:hypothetical protein
MRLIERYVIRVANFADVGTTQRILNASAQVRSTVGTHLILELIRRLRNDDCPIAWAGKGFANNELGRDELSNEAYGAAMTYCTSNTAAVVELMNVEGLRAWLEETLIRTGSSYPGCGRWQTGRYGLSSVCGLLITVVTRCRG